MRTIGIEEELFLVDPATGELTAVAQSAVESRAATSAETTIELELYQQQIELATAPEDDLDALRRRLVEARTAVVAAAGAAGASAVAMPVPVLSVPRHPDLTPDERYERIQTDYGRLARDAVACAMHLHVAVEDDEVVRVVDGVRPWLPSLLAISANSPFNRGEDTGHASWRSQVWSRWPSAGPRQEFGSSEEYDRTTRLLVEWGASLDEPMVYFDVRPGNGLPTVEIRVADVCTDVDDAILLAALGRALVTTAAAGRTSTEGWRADLLRAAQWRAAHDGLAGGLVDPTTWKLSPAATVLDALVEHVRDALEDTGDLDLVRELASRVLADGGGAERQRALVRDGATMPEVVADLARRTAAS
ncbi:glutamate--cysteine ligase [Nocardioides sp. HDW12B]|uniref:carboxylate-amine ligase n=1 Tax=Nocardioides sp. HDW12B TaxID=2714939 RepID=UPI00197EFA00|nr:glutamate--cysteine ligase [Nocardioides sp. HDW12B]